MIKNRLFLLLIAFFLILSVGVTFAQPPGGGGPPLMLLLKDGDWSDEVEHSGTAGDDVISTYTADDKTFRLTIKHATGDWTVSVERDSSWNDDLTLEVRRTTDGEGPGWIDGGTGWTSIGETGAFFFEGSGDRTDIKIQLRVTDVTAEKVSVTDYQTEVTYTLQE